MVPSIMDANWKTSDSMDNAKGIRVCQIICAAMILGIISFSVVILFIPGTIQNPMLSYVGLAVGVVNLGMRLVIPGIVTRTAIQKLNEIEPTKLDSQLLGVFQTKMIIGLAILESAGLLNLICYMVERQWWTFAFAGFLMFAMATMFPTLRQYESWADEMKRDLQNQF